MRWGPRFAMPSGKAAFMRLQKLAAASAVLLPALLQAGAAHAQSPFSGLHGVWSGNGQIRLENGATENIKCNAYYTSRDDGAGLGIALRCASQSYKIELRSKILSQSGRISGSWEERTFNASGTVSGQATGGRISMSVAGGGFTGSMAVNTSGASQSVAINTQGIGLRSVNINLSKTG